MDPAQPPRHARQGSVPVTIDLAANQDETVETTATEAGATEDVGEASEPVAADAPDSTTGETGEAKPDNAGPATSTAREPEPPRRGGQSLLSGLIGGLVVLAGIAGLHYGGLLPGQGTNQTLVDANARLSAELDAVKTRLDSLPQPDAAASAALETRLAALESRLAETPVSTSSDPARMAALTDEVTALKAALATATGDEAKARAALEIRLEATEKKVSEPRDDVEVARAIASAGLKAAIDRGGSFMAELETLANVIPDDPAITDLRAFAATGVPSRADLMAEFPDVANAILQALVQADPDQGLWDRLTASALSLVSVRPVGNVDGEGPDAVVARIETKLQNGDLKGAALEFDTLPEAGKTAGSAFKAKLDARLKVEDLVSGTLNRAMSGTAKAG